MTPVELKVIHKRLKEILPRIKYGKHALERMQEKGVKLPRYFKGKVIEFNRHNGDARALLRDEDGICIVVSLRYAEIITVYKNDKDDNHKTLDPIQYNRNLVVEGWGRR
jgi:hypothetical protein